MSECDRCGVEASALHSYFSGGEQWWLCDSCYQEVRL